MSGSKLIVVALLGVAACGAQQHGRARDRQLARASHHDSSEYEEDEDQPRDFSGVATTAPTEDDGLVTERSVAVSGIEGTMAEYDVRSVLQSRDADFDRCHDQHRGASGRIHFRIHVEPSGAVAEVEVRASNVRSQVVVACYSDVIAGSRFAPPHGGPAVVTWTTTVGKSRRAPDVFERKLRWDAPSS